MVRAQLICVGSRNKINQSIDTKWDDAQLLLIIVIKRIAYSLHHYAFPQHMTLTFRNIWSQIIKSWPHKYFVPSASCLPPTTGLPTRASLNARLRSLFYLWNRLLFGLERNLCASLPPFHICFSPLSPIPLLSPSPCSHFICEPKIDLNRDW